MLVTDLHFWGRIDTMEQSRDSFSLFNFVLWENYAIVKNRIVAD